MLTRRTEMILGPPISNIKNMRMSKQSPSERRNARVARGLPRYGPSETKKRHRPGGSVRASRRAKGLPPHPSDLRYQQNRNIRLGIPEKQEYLRLLKLVGCVDCGYNKHPAALQWDHLPGYVKICAVSSMAVQSRYTIEDLKAEIAKCKLVCANCHAIRTHNRRHKK